MASPPPRPQLVAPRVEGNPYTTGEIGANARPVGGMISVEQQRAIAEVQAKMMIAHSNPRDPIRATEMILNDCCRPTLAKAGLYQFARGGTDIKGPSIRLAEAMQTRWGNMQSGVTELARHGDYSACMAYAWDLENNVCDEKKFQVRHWRDTKQGGYQITDERDIYEMIANMGQRRKRACILAIIPGDVVEAAQNQCEKTMSAKADTSPAGIKRMLDAFAEFGVTAPQIEARIQRRIDAVQPAQVVALERIYNSLKDGMSDVGDWFTSPPLEEKPAVVPAEAPQTARSPGRGRRARQPDNAPTTPSPPSGGPPSPGRLQFEE